MSTNTKHSYKLCVKRATRRRRRIPPQQQQQQRGRTTTPSIGSCSLSCRTSRSFKTMVQMKGKCKPKLSQKLQALKNLIPPHNNDDMVKPDLLFKETADYIVLLRTRVLVLQKLIEYYGNNPENENAVLL